MTAFFTQAQHDVIRECNLQLRRNVRNKIKIGGDCFVCGEACPKCDGHVSHRVGFRPGIKRFGLRPEWLNRPDNLVWAHIACNGAAELPESEIPAHLAEHGLELPAYIKERLY